jgi:mono/diheme cytochrome c family protein
MLKAFVGAGIVLAIATTAWGYAPSSVAAVSGWKEVSFRKDVDPVLQHNCAVCHTPGGVGYLKSGFSVQSYGSVMKGTQYGAVVIPGSSASSSLMSLLTHGANSSINMPKMYEIKVLSDKKYEIVPKQAQWLSPHDVWLISGWIDQGAKDN